LNKPAPTEPLRNLCEQGDRFACEGLIEQTQDPDAALAMMIDMCEDDLTAACKRAARMTPDSQTLAQIDHLLCFRGDQQSCQSWLLRAQMIVTT
jgi:hypothetical protein